VVGEEDDLDIAVDVRAPGVVAPVLTIRRVDVRRVSDARRFAATYYTPHSSLAHGLAQLSLASLRGRLIEYQLRLG